MVPSAGAYGSHMPSIAFSSGSTSVSTTTIPVFQRTKKSLADGEVFMAMIPSRHWTCDRCGKGNFLVRRLCMSCYPDVNDPRLLPSLTGGGPLLTGGGSLLTGGGPLLTGAGLRPKELDDANFVLIPITLDNLTSASTNRVLTEYEYKYSCPYCCRGVDMQFSYSVFEKGILDRHISHVHSGIADINIEPSK